MAAFLTEILKEKQREIQALKSGAIVKSLRHGPRLDFRQAIWVPGKVRIIAEIKFASPSAGMIRERDDPVFIGRKYEEAGAAALSLVTEKRFFRGDINDIKRLKTSLNIPVLRKDFILDSVQIAESSLAGADAVLLIARILRKERLGELIRASREFGLEPLVEIHDQRDLEKAVESGAGMIGINNRNLDSFQVDTGITRRLAPLVPKGRTLVSESGVQTRQDILELGRLGIHAALVGSALMGSRDLFSKTRELVEAGKGARSDRKENG